MRLSCALACCAACSKAGCRGSLVKAALYCGAWEYCVCRGCCDCGWNCSNEWTLVVEARDSGRLLLVDIDVVDRERSRSVAIGCADGPCVYTKTKRWQRCIEQRGAATKMPWMLEERWDGKASAARALQTALGRCVGSLPALGSCFVWCQGEGGPGKRRRKVEHDE
jgi:hypothetical protein